MCTVMLVEHGWEPSKFLSLPGHEQAAIVALYGEHSKKVKNISGKGR